LAFSLGLSVFTPGGVKLGVFFFRSPPFSDLGLLVIAAVAVVVVVVVVVVVAITVGVVFVDDDTAAVVGTVVVFGATAAVVVDGALADEAVDVFARDRLGV